MTAPDATVEVTPELLPCPFCGSEAELREWRRPSRYQVRCLNPECVSGSGGVRLDRNVAITAWNTRQQAERDTIAVGGELLAHFTRMMEAAANYLEPTTYMARHPNKDALGPCSFNTEFPEPDENHSDSAKADIRYRRDRAFIRDMLYMLDGPEQRAALATPAGVEGMREALEKGIALIDDMSRFVGQMALKDYALFNEAPMLMHRALKSLSTSPDTTGDGR